MSAGNQANKVFISYSRSNSDFLDALRPRFKEFNLDVFLDTEDISPTSANWWDELKKGIQNAHIFVFVKSQESLASFTCQLELYTAIEEKKHISIIQIESENDDEELALQKLVDLELTEFQKRLLPQNMTVSQLAQSNLDAIDAVNWFKISADKLPDFILDSSQYIESLLSVLDENETGESSNMANQAPEMHKPFFIDIVLVPIGFGMGYCLFNLLAQSAINTYQEQISIGVILSVLGGILLNLFTIKHDDIYQFFRRIAPWAFGIFLAGLIFPVKEDTLAIFTINLVGLWVSVPAYVTFVVADLNITFKKWIISILGVFSLLVIIAGFGFYQFQSSAIPEATELPCGASCPEETAEASRTQIPPTATETLTPSITPSPTITPTPSPPPGTCLMELKPNYSEALYVPYGGNTAPISDPSLNRDETVIVRGTVRLDNGDNSPEYYLIQDNSDSGIRDGLLILVDALQNTNGNATCTIVPELTPIP